MEARALATPTPRDPYPDLLRLLSLTVVVAAHLGFTVLRWRDDGPHTTSPFQFTPGLWLLTWVLQVMPLFFLVGGFAQSRAFAAWPGSTARFLWTRLRRLLLPAAALAAAWGAAGLALSFVYPVPVVERVVRLVLSPLWFIGAYALVTAFFPVARLLLRRWGLWTLPALAVAAAVVDVARFAFEVPHVGWLNLVVVWGLAYTAGVSYDRWRGIPWWMPLTAGLALLSTVVVVFGYPGEMVGVPGRAFSNVAPPTVAVVGLLCVQVGLTVLLRPAAERVLARPGARRRLATANRWAMPVFLLHTSGAVLFLYGAWRLAGLRVAYEVSDAAWWSSRPVEFAGSLVCTAILVLALTRRRAPDRAR